MCKTRISSKHDRQDTRERENTKMFTLDNSEEMKEFGKLFIGHMKSNENYEDWYEIINQQQTNESQTGIGYRCILQYHFQINF